MNLFQMKDEPVSDRTPFLSVGNYTLELVEMGRGEKRSGEKFSYLKFRVIESDRADQIAGSEVTKWIQDSSFSVQKDLKIAISALLNQPASTLELKDVVPLFYPADKKEPLQGELGTGTEVLAGRKVRAVGSFRKKKDGTISTYPTHDFYPLDPPLGGAEA